MTLPLNHPAARQLARGWQAALCGSLLVAAPAVQAADWAFSGFGTVGYARSDQPYLYQRFIDEQGSFKRDTVLGGQLDLKLSPEWSATVQATAAPSLKNDQGWALTPSWAFVSWRPGNDWLLRAGKQRIPVYLNSENRDVGQTYDFVRLPAEVYATAPANECTGLYVAHNWLPQAGEATLEAFMGEADLRPRVHSRDLGAIFLPVRTQLSGAALTWRTDKATWRLGVNHAVTRLRNGLDLVTAYPYVSIAPGMGYYQVSGVGVGTSSHLVNDVLMLSGDLEVAPGWRVVGELMRNVQRHTDLGANTAGGYVAVLHQVGRFTPYASYAALRSLGAPKRVAAQLDASVLPGPGTEQLNASQRIASDVMPVYDQAALAIGSSYALTPQSKLKAEWAHVRIGSRSAMVDSPTGGEVVRHQGINVLSLSYSFVF